MSTGLNCDGDNLVTKSAEPTQCKSSKLNLALDNHIWVSTLLEDSIHSVSSGELVKLLYIQA